MFSRTGMLPGLVLLTFTLASALPHDGHEEAVARALPSVWYHSESHPVRGLFKRDVPVPGSPQWASQYPTPVPAPAPIPEALTPQPWLAALQAAEQSGKIPSITVPISTGGNPQYAAGDDPNGPAICSSTWKCRGAGDVWDAPPGNVGVGFDDGPTDGSAKLYQFLQQQNQPATHFMIGVNIVQNYALFNQAYNTLQHDIAVHTWTHPYMTTLNNTQVLAQLGWTMQVIHDSTGGRVPRYWRPPYGDSDNRVRAIAKEVFGLTQINWNQDSEDWSIAAGKTTLPAVETALTAWYAGSKTPGLIILEHELTNDTASAFIDTYPALKSNGWNAVSTVQLLNGAYVNAQGNTGNVQSMDILGATAASIASTSLPSAFAGETASGTPAGGAASGTSASPSASQSTNTSNNNNAANNNGALGVRHWTPSTVLAVVGALAWALW